MCPSAWIFVLLLLGTLFPIAIGNMENLVLTTLDQGPDNVPEITEDELQLLQSKNHRSKEKPGKSMGHGNVPLNRVHHSHGTAQKPILTYCTMNNLFCLASNYSKYVPPIDTTKKEGIKPLDVSIGFDNFEILKIDDRDFTVEINAYLIVKWRDTRVIIDFKQLYPDGVVPNEDLLGAPDWIPVELEMVSKLWLPDSEILRLKGFHSLSVLERLQGLWMSVRHEVLYVVATRIRFMCPMNYAKFPIDIQTCKFQIGSFNYDNTKMRYHTYYLPKLPNATESILDFEVHIKPLLPTERYYLPQETGNYSVAGFRMVMERKISHYVITYYLPSGLFVVVSWASFLIPADDIQGRMALLVTLFLVLVNIFNAITTNSPKADGLNALQAWIITCIFFVFGALLEYSVILLQLKLHSIQKCANDINGASASNGTLSVKVLRKNQMVARFDLVCLVFFPLLFLLFTSVYCLVMII